MRIPCPFCGVRDSGEFRVLGSAQLRNRPSARGEESQASFVDYVYFRENPAGLHHELWYHGFGCGTWLVVTRDTVTHEVLGAHFARQQLGA